MTTALPTDPPQSPTKVDLSACLSQNRDFIAWLTIPGTPIDYPVVRSNNTEHYLNHMFSGKASKLGTLFSLRSSDYQSPSKNIVFSEELGLPVSQQKYCHIRPSLKSERSHVQHAGEI